MLTYNQSTVSRRLCKHVDALHIISIFLFAFLFRICLVWLMLGLDWWYNSGEGYEHTLLSEYLLSRNCYMPPGQYLFAGAINQLFGQPSYVVLRVATMLLSAIVSVNIYRIGRDSFGMNAGIAAGYLSCISLSFAFHSWTFYPTILSATLFSFFMVHFLRMLGFPKRNDALLAGLFLGLSALTRTEMLIYLPLAIIWLFAVKGISRAIVWKGFVVLIVCGMLISCWTLRNYITCGRFVLVSDNAPVNYFVGNNPLQKGGYFPPHASIEQRENYLLSGISYDLNHPGWFVKYFAEKFRLCWSWNTGEHPLHLIESKFESSTVKLYHAAFSQSMLGAILYKSDYDSICRSFTSCYRMLIAIFWFFVLVGILSCHLQWKKTYFMLIICFTMTVLLSFFISGAQRWSMPMLPYIYIFMGAGIVFIFHIFTLTWSAFKVLLLRNAGVLTMLIIICTAGYAFIQFNPGEKFETIDELYSWNLFSTEGESVRMIILESQLAYPLKKDALTRERFSIRIGNRVIPHIEVAVPGRSHEKFYFKRVDELLCKNAIVINIPDALMHTLLSESGYYNTSLHGGDIISALRGRITIGYTPAWRFPRFVENSCNYLLEQILQKGMTGNAQHV